MRRSHRKNKKNYTHHTNTSKALVWWMLASTIQFSHNTTPHTTNHNQRPADMRAQQEQPMLPQTPNSAPTKNPFCHAKPVYPPTPTPRSTHPNQAPPSPPSSVTRRPAGMPPPGKNNTVAVTHSATQPHTPTTVGTQNKSSLERR